VSTPVFIDYYELLQLSANADTETIERIFRHLAKKFHPDNPQFADNDRFYQIVEAHRILADPEARARYDVRYQDYWNRKWKLASEASDGSAFGDDQVIREHLLSLLYVQRRRNMSSPGLGDHEIQRLLRIPLELVDFHMWYLKAKGWVERLESGQQAISALGVDQVEQTRLRLRPDRLLEEHSVATNRTEENHQPEIDRTVETTGTLPMDTAAESDHAEMM
jgi:DnaJ domain